LFLFETSIWIFLSQPVLANIANYVHVEIAHKLLNIAQKEDEKCYHNATKKQLKVIYK
jgi:hypothetical protein